MIDSLARHCRALLHDAIGCGLASALIASPLAVAAPSDGNYQTLLRWIDSGRNAQVTVASGRHAGLADRAELERAIPQTAWKYYFFDGMDMEIAPTGHYPPPSDWGTNVAKGYTLDADGVLAGFTGGGFPFPEIRHDDPQAAQKVVWNMMWRPGQYDYTMAMVTWLRSAGGKLDRQLEYIATTATYARGEFCLVPGYEEVRSKQILEFRSPRDMAGTKDMSIAYVDHYKENSGWVYVPEQRKPRRTMASERTGELLGMDMIRDDESGFGGKVYENTWRYLGLRKVLATVNVRDNPEFGGPDTWVPHRTRWELRDAHVIEITPKSSDHPYSHRIVFIDAETFWTLWMFGFDRHDDELLRLSQHVTKYSESYATEPPMPAPYVKLDYAQNAGHNVMIHVGETDINAKKPHATTSHCHVEKRDFTAARAKQYFSLRNMLSGKR